MNIFRKSGVKKHCEESNIDVERRKSAMKIVGYVGRTKEALQVAYKHSFFDELM